MNVFIADKLPSWCAGKIESLGAKPIVQTGLKDAELALMEESLSSAPEVMVAAAPRHRPEAAPVAVAPANAEPATAGTEELRKAIIEDLRRRNAPMAPKPVVIRRDENRPDGVLVTIH